MKNALLLHWKGVSTAEELYDLIKFFQQLSSPQAGNIKRITLLEKICKCLLQRTCKWNSLTQRLLRNAHNYLCWIWILTCVREWLEIEREANEVKHGKLFGHGKQESSSSKLAIFCPHNRNPSVYWLSWAFFLVGFGLHLKTSITCPSFSRPCLTLFFACLYSFLVIRLWEQLARQ